MSLHDFDPDALGLRIENGIIQRTFPGPPPWNIPGSLDGYVPPKRGFVPIELDKPIVSIVGTVFNESIPLRRSLTAWTKQAMINMAKFIILDDGSNPSELAATINTVKEFKEFLNIELWRVREPGPERSCTIAFNAAFKQLVTTPCVMFQWYDRIPGSPFVFSSMLSPLLKYQGVWLRYTGALSSGISRHIGGSSSVESMSAVALANLMSTVKWENDLRQLEKIAGPIGSHCVPGVATESSCLLWDCKEFEALGGYDERYQTRAGYVNVELFRRALQAGLPVIFNETGDIYNYHQSHGANREKDYGWLHDPSVVRNIGREWGTARVQHRIL